MSSSGKCLTKKSWLWTSTQRPMSMSWRGQVMQELLPCRSNSSQALYVTTIVESSQANVAKTSGVKTLRWGVIAL